MANIRIVRLKIKSSSQLEVDFTTNLDPSVSTDSISIKGAYSGIPDLIVTSVSVSSNILIINVRPMISGAYYQLTLTNLAGARGEQFIEDGTSNVVFFVGEIEESTVRDDIFNNIPDIYNKDSGSVIFNTVSASAKEIEKSSNIVGEVKSAGYVSIEIDDEEMTRGTGPFDRFANEGAFQILRVGSTITGNIEEKTITYDSFPAAPISLQQELVSGEIVSNTSTIGNGFIGLTVSLAKGSVIIVNSVILVRDFVQYTYDINQYRYGIKNYKYDPDNAYPALDLNNNQIILNDAAVGPTFPFPQGTDSFIITYYYKKEGRIVEPESLDITRVVNIIRESVPAVATTFFLNHAPIVDQNGNIPTKNGIVWLNPQQNFDPTVKHPAFTSELSFNQYSLPSLPGQFMVDYSTGRVFVFGVDGTGTDGTTVIPPVANYSYLKTYQNGLDYIFYTDLNEVASIPDRDLRYSPALVKFEYEDTYADGTDFNFNSHIEEINERVENRLIENIGLYTKKYPVNEVFRIFNETTGELYTPTRITNNEVYFSATTPPNVVEVSREAANFEDVIQSQLVIVDHISITGKSFVAFKIELLNSEIGSATGSFIGASFNSSLTFSDTTRFIREFFFDPTDTLATNLSRLEQIGDYVVDYDTGIVYLAQLDTADTEIGDATYKKTTFKTRNKHIIRATDIFRSPKVGQISKTYSIGEISDTTIAVTDLDIAGEREISVTDSYGNTTLQPIQVSSGTIEVNYDIFRLYHVFQITDLQTRSNPIDFGVGAVVSSSTLDTATLDATGVLIADNNDGYGLLIETSGTRVYFSAQRISTLVTSGYAELKSAISAIDINSGINYFSYGSDGYIDATTNRIYLPTGASFAAGRTVTATYRAKLRDGAAVLVNYSVGDVFIDYAYTTDEILISYEYGDNILDWSISDTLEAGETYYVSYRYGALRNSLRDNFGILTGIDELSTIPDELDRETYRHMVEGSLQSFPKGPTIPSIKDLVSALTQIDPKITETIFLEWILGRDFIHLEKMKLGANSNEELPTYAPGKFGDGLLLSNDGQTAIIPATSNVRFNEGTWEAFVVPNWSGIENDALLTFDLKFDGYYRTDKIFIGSNNENPTEIPFSLSITDTKTLGKPSTIHTETGYFIWYDIGAKKWRCRVRAPVGIELRTFTGTISTGGEFYDVSRGATADGYDGYSFIDGYYDINEFTDKITSSDTKIKFSFILDAYDAINNNYDAYDNYGLGIRGGFDGIDFSSDNPHYFFDTGVRENYCRMSLYKDGKGFLRFRVYDGNNRIKMLSANLHNWQKLETHHIACSWKIGTIEQRDELHLFVDGAEIPNNYRYRGYFEPPQDALFLDSSTEVLAMTAIAPTIGGFDLQTTAGSNLVVSVGSTFATSGVSIGDKFEILDDTEDGTNTQTYPYVFVKTLGENYLTLQTGLGADYNAVLSLSNVRFSVNPLQLTTLSDNDVEHVRVFSGDGYNIETELYAPGSLTPQYGFSNDGYVEYVNVYDGIAINDSVLLKSYGLMQSRCRQYVFVWPNLKTNVLNTIMPQPTDISKINVTKIIVKRMLIDPTVFSLIATLVGGHMIPVIYVNIANFCQPSNRVTGRKISATLYGNNIDWAGLNNVIIDGITADGYDNEVLTWTAPGTQTTEKFFTTITDIFVSVSPMDPTKPAGAIEIRETHPLNWQENNGNYAQIFLSVQQQAGINGVVVSGDNKLIDGYSRFGVEDIGKIINITSPSAIANVYKIQDVLLDPSGKVKDSNTIVLETYGGGSVSWSASYSNVSWKMLATSYGDSGFANGLITLEIARSGGQPFLLGSCWYEVDFPTYLTVPWPETPKLFFVGSDFRAEHQANAVIDEMRILDEMSVDTGKGSPVPSSGRSITTDNLIVRELSSTIQTLGLFHFDNNVTNSASFYSSYSPVYNQSENSVNANFKQSAIFNKKQPLKVDNKSIFNNNSGTIEFWVSPILDTYNDPTKRYFVDLTPAQQITVGRATTVAQSGIISNLLIRLSVRARTIDSVTVSGSSKNYFTGGTLSNDGYIIRLGQTLPKNIQEVIVTYVPITSQGDRFSLYKDEFGAFNLLVTASGVDYQIRAPIYWKKNSWHRVFVGWSLNNIDNQDRLVLMVDGTEAGIIRYGTGLKYGAGHLYGSPTVWGSATAGTIAARNILADINLTDLFNIINIGADFTGQFPAMARVDNLRFSSEMRQIVYLGGSGPGQLIGKDILYTSNVNTAQPVVSDALTRLLLDFDTPQEKVEYLATVRNMATGIFDFYVEVIDTFGLIDTDLAHELLTSLIEKLKPAHTRAFVSFTK
ncbi:MAG: hypothetical protein WC516_07325 [Patescibacteria group bacterium]|jgi:hypothetical protein